MPWARRTTFLLWGVSVALLALTVVAVRDLAEPAGTWIVGGTVLASLVPFAAGWLATRHDPANWVGTWLTAAGTNILLQMAHGNWADALAAAPSDLPGSAALLNLTQGVWMGWFVPFAMVLLLFPDGRPADRRARRTVVALLGSVVAFNALLAVAPGPLMPPLEDWPRPFGVHWVGYGSIPALLVFYGSLVMAALATRRRYRAASDEVARARLRWMFLTCLTVPATILLCWTGYLLTGTPVVALGGLIAMNFAIPAATLVAMLRHELYDVDRAVVAATVYPLLAFGVVAAHAGLSAALALALGAGSTVPAVLATVVVVVLLLPARALLLRVLGARLHPRRARGVDALRVLVGEVHAGTAQPERLEPVLQEALRDPGLRVGYRRPGRPMPVDVDGEPVPGDGVPIRLSGSDIGVIVPGPGHPRVPADVAREAALLAESVRLRGELSQALVEVDASRERLLRAGYEERRRLEMDLHDGAQQRLVSLGMRLRVAQHQVASGGSVALDPLVDDAVEELALAVRELREIAHGLRPSCLDDGLGPALESLSRSSALPLHVSYSGGDLPDHVSVTAYYVASEGVTNAVKHSGARSVALDVRRTDDGLHVAVHDDGAGGARIAGGTGLAMLHDRVRALGGRLSVTDRQPAGTSLVAVIPCGS
ncbi:MAG: histidine kinase [Tetrasphaera jenkinsii]|jgi:signal transduction histidine kinase|uniref:histidine kinase n=1 Tax=Nostocoides jenkinsii Ben 74 TaxID=1193518 RepID=A0A077MA91_9MICO|nr:histidine kinase [Tetrasphaera jenkinsii]MCI1261574.1 histidine kinase [Tetrasphaera jenkinsii]CCI53539.1 putative Histidine kinase [Tetrasphaera jenkinsii Ben 74]